MNGDMCIKPEKGINAMKYVEDMNAISRRNAVKLFGLWGLAALIAEGKASVCEPQADRQRKKILVAYYSYSGNTAKIADYIAEMSEAAVFEIVPLVPYANDYDAVVSQARNEIGKGYKPRLKMEVKGIEEYDVVFVGSPCWWATMAPPVSTFLSESRFSGKLLVPFMTHEGSGLGGYVDDVRRLCPDARVLDGRAFRGRSVGAAKDEVESWLSELSFNG